MKGARPLKISEVKAVAAKLGPRDRALFILGVCSGFRISEILSLRVGSVELAGRIAEQVAVERRDMKGKIEGRVVPLNDKARAAIAAWLKAWRKTGEKPGPRVPLFPSRKGRGPITRTQAWRILSHVFVSLGLSGKLGTHAMRKTFAHRMYESLGHDLIRTQKALGHKSVNSTVSYLSFAESEVNAAILAAW